MGRCNCDPMVFATAAFWQTAGATLGGQTRIKFACGKSRRAASDHIWPPRSPTRDTACRLDPIPPAASDQLLLTFSLRVVAIEPVPRQEGRPDRLLALSIIDRQCDQQQRSRIRAFAREIPPQVYPRDW